MGTIIAAAPRQAPRSQRSSFTGYLLGNAVFMAVLLGFFYLAGFQG